MNLFALLMCLSVAFLEIKAAKKNLHSTIKICRRRDPELSRCFRENFMKMLPLAAKGVPEMNLIALEPVLVEQVRMDFSQTRSVQLIADLRDVQVFGMSKMHINQLTVETTADDGLYIYFDLTLPKLTMRSKYKAKGKFLLLNIDTDGDYEGDFFNMDIKSHWNTTSYIKKGKRHLTWDTTIDELSYKGINVHFRNLFPNQTELNESMNKALNENADVLYDEVKPIIIQTVRSVSASAVNNIYNLFPYDMLFPVD